jgi:hypothetical protein
VVDSEEQARRIDRAGSLKQKTFAVSQVEKEKK